MLPAVTMHRRKLWTRAEIERMERAGLLEEEHVELIEGELINKMGEGNPHVISVKFFHGWLASVFGFDFVLQGAPIDVAPEDNPTSEPQPDVCVLTRPYWSDMDEPRTANDVRLAVEVSATSLYIDLKNKAGLYARAGIPEYWALDVESRRLYVHRYPENGKYKSVIVYGESESIAPLAAPDHALRIGDAFPGRRALPLA